MAKRKKILGMPIGRKKPSMAPKALAAGAGLAAVPTAVMAVRRMSDAVSTGKDLVSSGKEAFSSGKENVSKAVNIAGKVSDVAGAVSEKDSTIGKVGAAINGIRKLSGGDSAPKLSHLIEEHTEVAVPRSVAYNQWTQFETFPSIVKGAEQVHQRGRDKVEWTSKIGPSRRTWQGRITEQVPDERIAWKSTGGLQVKGVVTFHSLDDELTRVLVEMEYDPRGFVEHVGNLLRIQRRRVRRDLRLFKHFVELRGEETGAWRSRIAKKGDDEVGEDSEQDGGEGGDDAGGSSSRSEGRNGTTSKPRRQASKSSGSSNRSGSGRERRTAKAS